MRSTSFGWAAARALVAAAALAVSPACALLFPEFATKLGSVPPAAKADPPPPQGLKWMRVARGRVPRETRDGRTWEAAFGSLPDPFVKVIVNGTELFRTNAQANTLEPTWPDSPRGNFELQPDDKIRVEMWDSNALNDRPIGVKDVGKFGGDRFAASEVRIELEGGAEITLQVEPAHALFGLGLWYEVRNDSAYVTRLFKYSPASRAGIEAGDQLLELGGKKVSASSPDEVRGIMNTIPSDGLECTVQHPSGTIAKLKLEEGLVFPTFAERNPID
jgi:hypothetical protein